MRSRFGFIRNASLYWEKFASVSVIHGDLIAIAAPAEFKVLRDRRGKTVSVELFWEMAYIDRAREKRGLTKIQRCNDLFTADRGLVERKADGFGRVGGLEGWLGEGEPCLRQHYLKFKL